MADNKDLVVARFFNHTIPNQAASLEAGRPIYDDMECVEIRHPGDKLSVKVFPAHSVWKNRIDQQTGFAEPVTYAMRFPEQYKAFKNNAAQAASGTPIEELPFLTQAKRLELKALSIYTAEALAALDGQPLKQLGMGGRELKDQAQAYLDTAAKTAGTTAMAAEIARLKEEIEAMKAGPVEVDPSSPFADYDEEALKEWIKDATGQRPRGNPNRATLARMADEINADLKSKTAKEAA